PGLARAYNHLIVLLMDHGRLNEAIAVFEAAAARDPNLTVAYANAAPALKNAGDRLESGAGSDPVRALESKMDIGCAALGNALNVLDGIEPGKRWCRGLPQIDVSWSGVYRRMAVSLMRHERFDEAQVCITRILALEPGDLSAAHILAALTGAPVE